MASTLSSRTLNPTIGPSNMSSRSPNLSSVDDGSAALILRLQIQDIAELLPKGATSLASDLSPWQRDLLVQRDDLERRLSLVLNGQLDSGPLSGSQAAFEIIDISDIEERQNIDLPNTGRGFGGKRLPEPYKFESTESPTPDRELSRHWLPNPYRTEAGPSSQRQVIDLTTKRGRDEEDSDEPHKRRIVEDDDLFVAGSRPMRGHRSLQLHGKEIIDLTESPPLSPIRSTASPATIVPDYSPEADAVTLPCISCGEEYHVSMLAHMTCEHDYCSDCLHTLVKNSLQDEALYPPRCCRQPFEMDDMRPLLTPELISAYHEKKIEFASSNRLYCANPMCSTFLFPANIEGDIGQCPICSVATCTFCKAGAHQGECPQDEATQQVLRLAEGKGWRRCPKCMALVERNQGCSHMACRCKAQWCYTCGAAWRTCGCA